MTLLGLLSLPLLAQTSGYQVGDEAMGFNLQNVDGSTVSLDDPEYAKGAIVVFTCNTCPYAVAYQDRMIALLEKYASKGYPVIAINPNDASSVTEHYVEDAVNAVIQGEKVALENTKAIGCTIKWIKKGD